MWDFLGCLEGWKTCLTGLSRWKAKDSRDGKSNLETPDQASLPTGSQVMNYPSLSFLSSKVGILMILFISLLGQHMLKHLVNYKKTIKI